MPQLCDAVPRVRGIGAAADGATRRLDMCYLQRACTASRTCSAPLLSCVPCSTIVGYCGYNGLNYKSWTQYDFVQLANDMAHNDFMCIFTMYKEKLRI